jgi:ABC-type antimicrobial peptide transport system permease subunit
MALGAGRRDVVRAVVGEGMALAGAGVAIGLAAALIGSRLLSSLVFGVTTTDPATYAGVTAAVLGVAALASLAPALRASRVEPIESLRAD